jgi:hypothetical protein
MNMDTDTLGLDADMCEVCSPKCKRSMPLADRHFDFGDATRGLRSVV